MADKQLALTETLSAARILTAAEFQNYGVIDFDPNGSARNVDLPAGSAALAYQRIQIRNSASTAVALTVRLTGGGTTIVTIAQNQSAMIYCHGTVAPTYTALLMKIGPT